MDSRVKAETNVSTNIHNIIPKQEREKEQSKRYQHLITSNGCNISEKSRYEGYVDCSKKRNDASGIFR
jgi:hypothetical protein